MVLMRGIYDSIVNLAREAVKLLPLVPVAASGGCAFVDYDDMLGWGADLDEDSGTFTLVVKESGNCPNVSVDTIARELADRIWEAHNATGDVTFADAGADECSGDTGGRYAGSANAICVTPDDWARMVDRADGATDCVWID